MRNKEWKKYKLSDITSKLGDGLHGTPKYDNDGEYYFINGNNLENGKIVIKPDTKRVSFTEYQKYKKELNNNTILLSINGTLGNIGYYNNEKVILGKSACYFNLKDGFSKDYVRYIMSTKYFKLFLENFATGATIKNVSLDAMRNFEFYAPSKDLQDKIAKILSNYDNLIENNNKRIKILEEMAQKIYKEWFVDFKFPGHETTTFKDSLLGKIPNDWEVKPIEKLLIHQIGGGWGNEIKTDKYNTPAYVIRGADIPNGRQGCIENCPLRYHTSSNLKTRTLNENDIVFEVSGGSKGQPVGRTLILNKNLFNQFKNNVICASFCKLLRVDQTQIIPEYIYLHLLNIYNNGEIEKYQTQSTGIINFKFNFFLENEKILIPEQNIISKFEKIIKPIFDEIFLLGNKNQVLKQTRDILLPRLISGEIDVENMEIA